MVERPPPPDLPTRQPVSLPPKGWRNIRRSTVLAVVATALLIYEAVGRDDVRPMLLATYLVLMASPGPVAVNELVKALLLTRLTSPEDRP